MSFVGPTGLRKLMFGKKLSSAENYSANGIIDIVGSPEWISMLTMGNCFLLLLFLIAVNAGSVLVAHNLRVTRSPYGHTLLYRIIRELSTS